MTFHNHVNQAALTPASRQTSLQLLYLPQEIYTFMSQTPQSSSSPETETVDASGPDRKPSVLEHEFVPSVLDEPNVNVSEYLEAKQRAARRTRRFLQFAVGIAVIAVPFTYLKMNGTLSRNGIKRALNQKVDEPANSPAKNSTFGLSAGVDPSVAGTVTKTKKSKAVAQDLTNYVYKDLKGINVDELKALTAFDRVTGRNFTTEAATFAAVQNEVIPAYGRFVLRAAAIQTKTPEVSAVHKVFVQSAKVKALAFRHLLEGRGDKTASWQYGVKAEFDASAQLANQFKVQIGSLAGDQDVTLP